MCSERPGGYRGGSGALDGGEGMAYLLIFGLAAATVLTLLVLPTIYAAAVEYLGLKVVPIPTKKDNDDQPTGNDLTNSD